MSSGGLFPFMYHGSVSDLNNATEAGFYSAVIQATNSPTYYPVVIVFRTNQYIIQLAIELTVSGTLYERTGSNEGWLEWRKITTTSL